MEEGCWTEGVFHLLRWATGGLRPIPHSDDKGEGRASMCIGWLVERLRVPPLLLMTQCRTYGAPTACRGRRILFGLIPQPFRAGLHSLAVGPPGLEAQEELSSRQRSQTLGMTKGRAVFPLNIRRLVERTAGPHSTSLRAGSPLRPPRISC
jgi:hypothetical protein